MNLKHRLSQHSFISKNVELNYFTDPFPHLVIDNLFNDSVYEAMVPKFKEYISRVSKPCGIVGENKELFYNATIYPMKKQDCVEGWKFFVEKFWKDFISDVFSIVLNQHTAYSLHFHKGSPATPSKSGWSHKDLGICSARDKVNGEVEIIDDCDYVDDSDQDPTTNKVARSVAMLYYLDNIDNPSHEDGGGTGIYDDYKSTNLIKTILPKNNRLFAFEISPSSYHGFIGAKFDRSATVQWFHSSPAYIVNRYLEEFKKQYKIENNLIFERWKPSLTAWSIENDPTYYNFFDEPLIKILENS